MKASTIRISALEWRLRCIPHGVCVVFCLYWSCLEHFAVPLWHLIPNRHKLTASSYAKRQSGSSVITQVLFPISAPRLLQSLSKVAKPESWEPMRNVRTGQKRAHPKKPSSTCGIPAGESMSSNWTQDRGVSWLRY